MFKMIYTYLEPFGRALFFRKMGLWRHKSNHLTVFNELCPKDWTLSSNLWSVSMAFSESGSSSFLVSQLEGGLNMLSLASRRLKIQHPHGHHGWSLLSQYVHLGHSSKSPGAISTCAGFWSTKKRLIFLGGTHRARTQEFDEIESANNIIQHYPTMIGMQTDVSPLRPGMISVFLDIRNPKINNVPSRSFMLRPIDRKLSRTD